MFREKKKEIHNSSTENWYTNGIHEYNEKLESL